MRTIKRYSAMTVAMACVSFASAENARDVMKRGLEDFTGDNYAAAAEAFTEAAEQAADLKLDPARAWFNLGAAQYRNGDFEKASEHFQRALETTDATVQNHAYFNLGNAQMALGANLMEQQQMQPALQAVQGSLESYQNAMMLSPEDQAPKVNFELALQKEQEIKQLMEQQPQDQNEDQQQDENEDEQQEQNQDQQNQDENEDEQEKQEQQESEEEQENQEQQQEQNQPQEGDPEDQQEQQAQPQEAKPEEMTEEQAAMLLDALKENERAQRELMRLRLGRPIPVDKNW